MLKVAIVGAGTMGSVHSVSYRDIEGVQVTAVCDIQMDKAVSAAAPHGARCYEDFDTMLSNEAIDIVDICLPTYLHREYVLKAIDRGKHVFCEKPIALSLRDAKDMVRAAGEKGIHFSVGHVVRFFPAYSKAAEVIKEGKIGIPRLIRTTRTGAYPWWNWNGWYSNYDLSGGPIIDLVIHDFDWIRYNFGDIERVYAKDLADMKLNGQDHCLITLRLKNGAIAHIEGSWAYPPGSIFGTTFEIIGTEGQIESDSRKSSPVKKHISTGSSSRVMLESPLYHGDEPYTAELREYVNSIIEDREPAISGEDAIKALEISLAAVKSARTGEVVFIGGESL
jgi:Predicted dehydrogenases and related proteins